MNEHRAAQRKASVRDVRKANRALLLRHLLFGGETSRASLGEDTSLSPATVTNLVAELIAEGTVVERGQSDSPGGRPRTLIAVNPEAAVVFGADVGETRVSVEASAVPISTRLMGGLPTNSATKRLAGRS